MRRGGTSSAGDGAEGRSAPWYVSPYLLLTLTSLFWAGNFIVGRAVRDAVPPIGLAFWRWTIAMAILLPFVAGGVWRYRGVIRREWRILLALGVTGVGAFHSFVYLALQSTPAINAVLFLATTPLVIIAISRAAFGDRIGWAGALGALASLAGVIVVIARGDVGVLLALGFNPGDLWMLGAVSTWAVYSVCLKRRPQDLPPLILLAVTMVVGTLAITPAYVWEYASGDRFDLDIGAVLGLAYVATFASIVAYVCWNQGVKEVGPNRAGVFINLIPVFAALLAIVFLGERVAGYHLAAAALVFAGVVLINRERS
jgi:drug/metabolite transporter (DMT)-like permease